MNTVLRALSTVMSASNTELSSVNTDFAVTRSRHRSPVTDKNLYTG